MLDINQIRTSMALNGGLTYFDHQDAVTTQEKLKALGLETRMQYLTLKDPARTMIYRLYL